MELPDCPPGAEGYQDSVVEVPKKRDDSCPPGAERYQDSIVEVPKKPDDSTCTKAELEFQEHLQSLKIKLENNETRCMVERRERSISGKWTYLCFPCAAVCSGESVLQTHLSGKKHKAKLATKNVWPLSIFDDHPFNHMQKQAPPEKKEKEKKEKEKAPWTKEMVDKNDPDFRYNQFLLEKCHIQDAIDEIKAPLIGLEYLVENPPEEVHYEPTYLCTLCNKQGHPRTIINHMTCFWHRYNYLYRHFPKASGRLNPYKSQAKYRESVNVMLHKLCQRIEDKYGRLKPINIDKELYEREKDEILKWIFKGTHFMEKEGCTFEEVVDVDLMESMADDSKTTLSVQSKGRVMNVFGQKAPSQPMKQNKKDPSPPKVAAPSRPNIRGRNERRTSLSSLSDISDEDVKRPHLEGRDKHRPDPSKLSFDTYADQPTAFRSRYAIRNAPDEKKEEKSTRPPNYEYKVKLIEERCKTIEESAKKMLAYHEKNPEKHPLYPDEWKKFWNRRYKEIQAEGKDPSKHDFKPEWIAFWTKRMKELHEEDVRVQVLEIYRKLNMAPPDLNKREEPKVEKVHDRDVRRDGREKDIRSTRDRRDVRRSVERRHSPDRRRRSPEKRPDRRRSPGVRRHSPERRRSPELRRRSPDRKRDSWKPPDDYRKRPSPSLRRRSPEHIEHRSSYQRSRSPPRKRTKSRSPRPSLKLHLSPERRRSRSPLSRRATELPLRNRSPAPIHLAPSMQTVLVSDEELKPDDNLSPWNSDNEIMSIGSRSESASVRGRGRVTYRAAEPSPDRDQGGAGAEHVIATLRTLVALEDYLGSLGPKIVDLLTEAITMEKDRANSSEDLLERESAVVLIETAKEKLKGAAQAGLVAPGAVHAVRAAVVRAAATLHEADLRAKNNVKKPPPPTTAGRGDSQPLPVAGVGTVDRALIARQMAAALIAQGKTDVTSEELAQLVDAVVGMAEAKKREAESNLKKAAVAAPSRPASKSAETTSALQLLQSAYDETEKKIEKEKEEPTDAMDGLSDSDLETLLKNFNELSAEEQHSLIAYLKKLEARDPLRVEKLRQYVSAAATTAPKVEEPAPPVAPAPAPVKPSLEKDLKPVTIESDDDDDYTVDEVFKSAKEKVQENQIRQEMEIVKKSLEENKAEAKSTPPPDLGKIVDLSRNLSSASDLLALVQASIASTATNSAASAVIDVVPSSTQPRSFGDMPEPLAKNDPPAPTPILTTPDPDLPKIHFNGNFQNEQFNKGDSYQNTYTQPESYDRNEPYNQTEPYNDGYNQDNTYNQGNFNNQTEPFNNQTEPFNNQTEPFNQGGFNNRIEPFNQGGFNNQNQGGFNNQNQGGFNNQNQGAFNNQNQGAFNNQNQRGFNNQNEPFNQGGFNNQNEVYNQGGYNNQKEPFNQGGFNQNTPFNQGNNFNQNTPFNQNDNFNPQPWNSRPFNNMPDNRGPGMGPGFNNFGPRDNFNNKPMDMNNQNRNFRGGRGNRGGPRGGGGNIRGRGRGGRF